MRTTTPLRTRGIKQFSELQERTAIDPRLLSGLDARARDFIEHPRWNATPRLVVEDCIHQVALAASAARYFQLTVEERMIWVEDPCGRLNVSIVERGA